VGALEAFASRSAGILPAPLLVINVAHLRRGEASAFFGSGDNGMLFMVIERFKNRDPDPIYRRMRENGRMLPEGLKYVASWIEENFDRCFQIMECDDPKLFELWAAKWSDLVDFEIVPVSSSQEAAQKFASKGN
jgi:Protein of unknown function (DUF3303)